MVWGMEPRNETRDWLRLSLTPGIGTTLFIRLLARFGTPASVLEASEAAVAEVVGPKRAQRIRAYAGATAVDDQIAAMERYDAHFIAMDDPAYPQRLAEIYAPPLGLFCRGELHASDEYCVGIVGTRKPSAYGVRMAEQLAGQLAARGIAVVSGLAAGVDAAAHRGALDAGGRTLAILGCGVDVVFPPENAELMHRIVQHGCVLSPFPMGMKPLKGNFPQRNPLISGISLGTLVIEAPPGSGALITAHKAAEQGREVFALPGRAGDRNSLGPHALIREGAKLVETVEDILVELALPTSARVPSPTLSPTLSPTADAPPAPSETAPRTPPPPAAPASEVEKDVMASLGPDGSFVDEIALACRIPVSEALSSLTMLELKGLVRQLSGKRFALR